MRRGRPPSLLVRTTMPESPDFTGIRQARARSSARPVSVRRLLLRVECLHLNGICADVTGPGERAMVGLDAHADTGYDWGSEWAARRPGHPPPSL